MSTCTDDLLKMDALDQQLIALLRTDARASVATLAAKLKVSRGTVTNRIAKLEAKIVDPRQIKLSKTEFLNVIKTAAAKMRAGSAVEKDVLCRILFLNLRVDNEKVASYLWKEPFASLVKATELSYGRGDRT